MRVLIAVLLGLCLRNYWEWRTKGLVEFVIHSSMPSKSPN